MIKNGCLDVREAIRSVMKDLDADNNNPTYNDALDELKRWVRKWEYIKEFEGMVTEILSFIDHQTHKGEPGLRFHPSNELLSSEDKVKGALK